MISIQEFQKLDIRVAKILEARQVEGANNLLHLKIDLGEEQRELVAGIAETYRSKDLINKNIVVLINLEPKKIRGIESQGMLLAADAREGPILLVTDKDVPPGTKIR